ncbi:MAG TPA: hypothetical protein VF845_07115 [Terriglobales bacterium]
MEARPSLPACLSLILAAARPVVNPPLPEGVEAKTFAVTLEPESGSHEAPRGTPVIVGAGE